MNTKPTLNQPKSPRFLRDVTAMKRERGDTDIAEFRDVCRDFASGGYATIQGAARAMRQWTSGKPTLNAYWRPRHRFLADLDAVENGTFFEQEAA